MGARSMGHGVPGMSDDRLRRHRDESDEWLKRLEDAYRRAYEELAKYVPQPQ